MPLTLTGSTIAGLALGGLPNGIGTVLQIVEATGNTATWSTSQSYTETVITGAITPLKSDSTIYIDVAAPHWPAENSYSHIQLRSSGGVTNNDIGVHGDNYSNPSAMSFNVWLPWKHTHGTTSAITYKVFCKKQNANGANWYLPNNNTGNCSISWTIRMTEVLS